MYIVYFFYSIHSEDSPCLTKTANLFQDENCCFICFDGDSAKHVNINLKEKDLHGKVRFLT